LIIVFDLDDTLYQEITYVRSGLAAVAQEIANKYNLNQNLIYSDALLTLDNFGRGHVFDIILRQYGLYSKREVNRLLSVYRSHNPLIEIDLPEIEVLRKCQIISNLYLVTDGNKNVQAKKIEALKINTYFTRIFITHRFGLEASKPSLKCFEQIREFEKVRWSEIVYIGDDPNKDFVNLKKVGATTIRVMTGRFRNVTKSHAYEADWHINSLSELPELLEKIKQLSNY
jgi:putative hydrolase of the HAD superfamily